MRSLIKHADPLTIKNSELFYIEESVYVKYVDRLADFVEGERRGDIIILRLLQKDEDVLQLLETHSL